MGAGNVRSFVFELALALAGWEPSVRRVCKVQRQGERYARQGKKDRKTEGKFNIHLQSNRQYYCSYQYKHCQLLID